MARGTSTKTKMSKTLDTKQAERILMSNKPRDVKLRELSQLQNGRMKLGTMQAKNMLDNYNSRKDTNFMQNLMQNLDPETRRMVDQVRTSMSEEEREKFDTMSAENVQEFIKNNPEPVPVGVEEKEVEEEIKEEDLPTMSKDEFNLLNRMLKK